MTSQHDKAKRWLRFAALLLSITAGCASVPSSEPEPLTDEQQQTPYVDEDGELHGGTI